MGRQGLVNPWRSLMRQSISVAARSGTDEQGAPSYGTATTYKGRLVGRRRRVLDSEGREVISTQTVYLATDDVILPTAKVTLSTADVGSTEPWALTPPIISTGRWPDERGWVYTALYLR